ncbi:MAG: hypothetical protein J6C37_04075, partial [Roseburia sp.]|nr:hypothetical protein [Roseburia sp.]
MAKMLKTTETELTITGEFGKIEQTIEQKNWVQFWGPVFNRKETVTIPYDHSQYSVTHPTGRERKAVTYDF